MKTIHRYIVPIDDRVHAISMTSADIIRAVELSGTGRNLSFWAEHYPDAQARVRKFTVHGTGHQIDDKEIYRSTSPRTETGLVWHLYEVPADQEEEEEEEK